jgi:hypothetical protein
VRLIEGQGRCWTRASAVAVWTMQCGVAVGSRRHPAGGLSGPAGCRAWRWEKGARPTRVAESWPDPGGTALPD